MPTQTIGNKFRILRILKRFALWVVLPISVLLILLLLFFSNQWRRYYSVAEMHSFAQVINDAPALSDNFYKVYDQIHPGERNRTMLSQTWSSVTSFVFGRSKMEPNHCPCCDVFFKLTWDFPELRNGISKTGSKPDFIIGWGIEKYSTPEKCFDFNMLYRTAFAFDSTQPDLHSLLGFNAQDTLSPKEYAGVENSAIILFQKPLEKLSDDEIIELIILLENPYVYNKTLHPERFRQKFLEYKSRIQTKPSR